MYVCMRDPLELELQNSELPSRHLELNLGPLEVQSVPPAPVPFLGAGSFCVALAGWPQTQRSTHLPSAEIKGVFHY